MVYKVNKSSEKRGAIINTNTIKMIKFSRSSNKTEVLKIENETAKNADQFHYLRALFTNDKEIKISTRFVVTECVRNFKKTKQIEN